MITVAAKDIPGGDNILRVCSRYMHELVSEISAGKQCGIEAVEALLLLAEWEPQSSLSNLTHIGCGEEDSAAWMHIGLALRLAFLLKLDRSYVREESEERIVQLHRERLAWAGMLDHQVVELLIANCVNGYLACYLSDRQISVRIGGAFWFRGPCPAAVHSRYGFPSLQPELRGDDDHASVLQARLELTQIYSDVHEVLYSGLGNSKRMGNYVKYIDDFQVSIITWKSIWGTLTCNLLWLSFVRLG